MPVDELARWRVQELSRNNSKTDSCHPAALFRLLREMVPEVTLFVSDCGTPCPYLSACFESPEGRHFLIPRAHGGLGWALPATVGVHFGLKRLEQKDRKIVTLMGDGSIRMSMNELITVAAHKINAMIILVHNDEYSWVKTGQKMGGVSTHLNLDFPDCDYAGLARAMGMKAESVADEEALRKGLRRALKTTTPYFLDVKCDPLWKDLPPVIGWRRRQQATK